MYVYEYKILDKKSFGLIVKCKVDHTYKYNVPIVKVLLVKSETTAVDWRKLCINSIKFTSMIKEYDKQQEYEKLFKIFNK